MGRVGRPLKFKTPEILQAGVKKYFLSCFEEQWKDIEVRDEKGYRILNEVNGEKKDERMGKWKTKPELVTVQIKPVTVSGLAYALNTSRNTLLEYEGEWDRSGVMKPGHDKYVHIVKGAKDFILRNIESGFIKGTISPIAGIFTLKNGFGFKDKTEVDSRVAVTDLASMLTAKKDPTPQRPELPQKEKIITIEANE